MKDRLAASIRQLWLASLCLGLVAAPRWVQAQTNPPAWSSTAQYAVGDLVSESGDIFRCTHPVTTGYLDPAKSYSYWELYFVGTNTTLPIGAQQTFPNFSTAWSYCLGARVADNATLTLSILTTHGAFAQTFTSSFSLNHAFGSRIAIVADYLDTNAFTFSNATDGFTLDTNHTIGSISGLSVYGNLASGKAGIRVSSGASIGAVRGCWIQNFDTSMIVSQNATANVYSSYFEAFITAAVQATSGATLTFPSGAFVDGSSKATTTSVGLYATDGGHIVARKSTLKNIPYGAMATTSGSIDIENSTLSTCTVGCYATMKAFVDCEFATLTGNTYWDVDADFGGTVNALYANPTLFSSGSGDGSYIYH